MSFLPFSAGMPTLQSWLSTVMELAWLTMRTTVSYILRLLSLGEGLVFGCVLGGDLRGRLCLWGGSAADDLAVGWRSFGCIPEHMVSSERVSWTKPPMEERKDEPRTSKKIFFTRKQNSKPQYFFEFQQTLLTPLYE